MDSNLISKIFPNCDSTENRVLSSDEIEYLQLEYLTGNEKPDIVRDLISRYSLNPSLVVNTILMIYDDPSICNISCFPLSCITELAIQSKFESMEIVLHLCKERSLIFINLLYKISIKVNQENKGSFMDLISDLLNSKENIKALEDPTLWGLKRERIGVPLPADQIFNSAFPDVCVFDAARELSNRTGTPYFLPFFLENIFELVSGFSHLEPKSNKYLAELDSFFKRIYEIFYKILQNPKIKDNYCNLIKNVTNQERDKLNFDEATNASDSFCFVLFHSLLGLGKGAFNSKFINYIEIKAFPTFCFFYVNKLMGISINRLIGDLREEYNQENSMLLLSYGSKVIQQYCNFVYDTIKERYDDVNPNISNMDNNTSNVDTNTNNVDNNNVDNNTNNVDNNMKLRMVFDDPSFLANIFAYQSSYNHLPVSSSIYFLIRKVLAYSNTYKADVLKILRLQKFKNPHLDLDQIIVGQLISLYADKNIDNHFGTQFQIHIILTDLKLDNGIYLGEYQAYSLISCLRMASSLLSSFEDHISKVFSTIEKINHHQAKILYLESRLRNRVFDEFLSDDDQSMHMLPESHLIEMSKLPESLLDKFISTRYLRQDEDINSVNNISIMKNIKGQVKYFRNSDEMKIFKKLFLTESRFKTEESILTSLCDLLLNLLQFLGFFLADNKRLFLNKNIFLRLNGTLNSALNFLVGENSSKVKLKNKEKYNFNPKEILRLVLLIFINLFNNNKNLVVNSEIDPSLLMKGINLATSMNLLMEEKIRILKQIHSYSLMKKVTKINMSYDIPDEYLDPLTFDLMKDPVVLLTSRTTIDRNTFNQIMMNDQIDPFSRLPLDESKIQENKPLREEIQRYLSKG